MRAVKIREDQLGGAVVSSEPELEAHLSQQGYQALCRKPVVGVCGVREYLFTGGLVTGLAAAGYAGRYCYKTMGEAVEALRAWDGQGDAPGAWIKFKSATAERLGPGALGE